jgi:hypothetical protein
MAEKKPDDVVVVWRNTTNRPKHRDSRRDGGGIVFQPGGSMVMGVDEREQRGSPPSNVKEEVMTRAEAKKKYGKDPIHNK